VRVLDDDLGTLLIEQLDVTTGAVDNRTRVLEGGEVFSSGTNVGNSAIDDVYRVRLSVAPTSDVTVTLDFDASQVRLFDSQNAPVTQLSFTPSNWSDWVTLTVKAVNTLDDGSAETTRENAAVTLITHKLTSADAVFAGAQAVELNVRVLDDDSAAVIVSESKGATRLVKGVSGDDYTLRLVNEPVAPVTVNLFGDGQTRVVAASLSSIDRLSTATVGEPVSVVVTVGSDTILNEGTSVTRDTLSREDGLSWGDDGYRVGTLFSIDAGSTLLKVNDIVDVTDPDTGLVIRSTLILTLSGDVSALSGGAHTFQRVAYAVVFDASNWWQEVEIEIEADLDFVADVSNQFLRHEPVRQHLVSQISGPLIIEGGVAEGKDRSLKAAVMLPTESTRPAQGHFRPDQRGRAGGPPERVQ
jgi:hypothetical protein